MGFLVVDLWTALASRAPVAGPVAESPRTERPPGNGIKPQYCETCKIFFLLPLQRRDVSDTLVVGRDAWALNAACRMANHIWRDDLRESVAMAVEDCRDERGVDRWAGRDVGDVDRSKQPSLSRLPDRRSFGLPTTSPSGRRSPPA